MCSLCHHSGYLTSELPVFAGGNYADVEQIEVRCNCNPEPTDTDYLAAHPWHDDRPGRSVPARYPEFDVPVVDFDPPFAEHRYAGI